MSDSSDDERNEKLKIIVLGASASGKSSICHRYERNIFKDKYNPTLGVDFVMKRISLKEDIHVLLQIWDLSGGSAGTSMLENYLYECHGILLVYDVTDSKALHGLSGWLNSINHSINPNQPPPKIMLVGNKIDMEHAKAIKNEDHVMFANRHHLMHSLTSAKTGDSINSCFRRLINSILDIKSSTTNDEMEFYSMPLSKPCDGVSGSGDVAKQLKGKESLPLKTSPAVGKQSAMCVMS